MVSPSGLEHNGTFPGYSGQYTTGVDAMWQLSNGFLLLCEFPSVLCPPARNPET
jgi:hypothetical protein